MKRLSALSEHILTLPGITRDRVDAFADLGKLIPTGQDLGEGFEVGWFKYDAVIEIDRCPAEIAEMMLASLLIWLGENDPDREERGLEDPDVDVTLEDEQTVHVQITVEFKEAITIIPDDDGQITWNGQTWSVEDIPINVATTLNKIGRG